MEQETREAEDEDLCHDRDDFSRVHDSSGLARTQRQGKGVPPPPSVPKRAVVTEQ